MKTISNQSMITVALLITMIFVSSLLIAAIGTSSNSSQIDKELELEIVGEPSGCGCGDPIVTPQFPPWNPPPPTWPTLPPPPGPIIRLPYASGF